MEIVIRCCVSEIVWVPQRPSDRRGESGGRELRFGPKGVKANRTLV